MTSSSSVPTDMPDFVDELRSGRRVPAARTVVRSWGFDPDLRHVGWGVIVAEVGGSEPEPLYYTAGVIRADDVKLTSIDQVAAMVRSIVKWKRMGGSGSSYLIDPCTEHVTVEGQEFYSRSKVDANDLLRLAQITGALQTHLTAALKEPDVVLPRTWKGQKQKEGMHARCMDWLQAVSGRSNMLEETADTFGAAAQHLFDALCMAKWRLYR